MHGQLGRQTDIQTGKLPEKVGERGRYDFELEG